MSDVKKISPVGNIYGWEESEFGEFVLSEDYDALEAEAQALREQNTKFQHMLADIVSKHFAENVKRSAAQKSMDVYLSEGIRLLEEELEALRARVAVFPDFDNDVIIDTFRRNGFLIELGASYSVKGQIAQLLNALEELARLNGKAVSEGLLRETVRSVDDIFWAIHAKPSCQSGVVARCRCRLCAGTRLAMARDDLNALLGEVNEHE